MLNIEYKAQRAVCLRHRHRFCQFLLWNKNPTGKTTHNILSQNICKTFHYTVFSLLLRFASLTSTLMQSDADDKKRQSYFPFENRIKYLRKNTIDAYLLISAFASHGISFSISFSSSSFYLDNKIFIRNFSIWWCCNGSSSNSNNNTVLKSRNEVKKKIWCDCSSVIIFVAISHEYGNRL